MSKEKQIEEIVSIINSSDPHYECKGTQCKDCEFFFINKNCYAAKALYNAGYRKQSEWISVDERLPEENGRYLACVDISHLAFENLSTIAIMAYGKSHGFYLYNENETVTHWMPLPEPAKMKGGAE